MIVQHVLDDKTTNAYSINLREINLLIYMSFTDAIQRVDHY